MTSAVIALVTLVLDYCFTLFTLVLDLFKSSTTFLFEFYLVTLPVSPSFGSLRVYAAAFSILFLFFSASLILLNLFSSSRSDMYSKMLFTRYFPISWYDVSVNS